MTGFAPIAIVGRACLLPGASSPEDLWEAVVAGRDLTSSVPPGRWGISHDDVMCDGPADSADRTWSDRGGYVEGFDALFDPEGFALPADEIRALDPVFQWTFHTARQALRDAGHADADPARFGAIFGNLSFPSAGMAAFTETTTLAGLPGYGPDALAQAELVPGDPRNRFMSGLPALLLERALGLGVGAFALDAACASSLYAIKLACDRLHDGEADLMLAGAVNSADDLCIHLGFSALTALSRTGMSRPFHAEADGLVPAEGCGFVALRRLENAVRDGDTIHGIIRGIGLSNDGRGRGMLVPSSDGQERAMRRALDASGLAATDVSLLECHATGTPVGDATEIRSSAAIYESCEDLAIGSLKSNTGHLITAAGVAGLIKILESMRHEVRPPTIHVEAPLADIDASPFRLLTEAEPWDRSTIADGVLRAGVSAFGFGGNNAHVIVEEPSAAAALSPPPAPAMAPPVAIVGIGVSAASATGRTAFTDALLGNTPCLDSAGHGRMAPISLDLATQKFPPNDLEKTLAQQLAILQVTEEAIADVGSLPTQTTGVYVGMGTDPEAARFGIRWRLATRAASWGAPDDWVPDARDAIGPVLDAPTVLGTMPNIVANRLNSQFDLEGPSFSVSSEEHSGLDALSVAVRALGAAEIDAAIVGAVDLSCEPVHQIATATCLDPDRQIPGDAAVALVLKRLDDAERDGDTVYAVLPGGRFDPDGVPLDDRPDLVLGLKSVANTRTIASRSAAARTQSVTHLFGHAHAASGLVHLAAAAISLHHRIGIGDVPLLASNPASGSGLGAGIGPRTVAVEIHAMDGISPRSVLLAETRRHRAPTRSTPPRLHIFSGADTDDLLEHLRQGRESNVGPARLVIVADAPEQLRDRAVRAARHIEDGHPAGEGVHYRATPIDGEIAFVFTAAGAAYAGMGAQLLRAIPEVTDAVAETFPLGDVSGWVYGDRAHLPTPTDFLWGASLLSSAHAHLTRQLLGLRPAAAIGYSSGESNSLFAFGIWSDRAAMHAEIDASAMMDRELGVAFTAVARAWGEASARWAMWNVTAPITAVRAAIAGEPRVHLAIINTASDAVIGGDPAGCERVVDTIGRRHCRLLDYNLACHVPEVREGFHQQWLDIHTRRVTPMPGLRLYSNGTSAAYDVSSEACAEAITFQAEHTLDFPATIEAAYRDGVRIFVEHGPSGACTNFISEILGDREFLAIQLDRRDKNIEQVFEVAAALVAAGVDVDHGALTDRLTGSPMATSPPKVALRSFPTHPAPVALPPRPIDPVRPPNMEPQHMTPAPPLPPVGASVPMAPQPVSTAEIGPAEHIAAEIHAQVAHLAALHHGFIQQRTDLHAHYLATRSAAAIAVPEGTSVEPTRTLNGDGHGHGTAITVRSSEPTNATGPTWDKEQLKIHSSGRISELFGELFAPQDERTIQCRMPEPPLLLADRVTGLDAEPGVLGCGTIWTETDVVADAWYLNDGHMPTGFMIESGQADLMLISYMGIDLITDPDRAYRLLGCTLTYHGDLPSVGETLEYEIRITGHARHGDIRLFFFEYDCMVDGVRRLTVRDGQAGFFTPAELADALGVLWTPESAAADLDAAARVDPPAVPCEKTSFTNAEVVAFSEGRIVECFGPGFARAETHTRTPKIQSGDQLFIDEVSVFDPAGGPWGRGFMRCETAIADDSWFFDGHFKNDPCMPGNFMVEACVEAMSFYLTAMGFTTRRDGWRFQPRPNQSFELKCRGEINPRTERVVYEVHVEEIWSSPHPTIICDVLGFVDGRAAFHAHRIAVELAPGWPLTSMPELLEDRPEPLAVATDREGFPFDWKAMISCAWGRPSEAFGSMYAMFDGTRRSPRLPGPPYHFISRVTQIDGELDVCTAGMEIVCEYDIPADAWYFDENGTETMPFAVLLEAALQPCGWVASAVGSVTAVDDDLLFRNLDGTGTMTGEVSRNDGTLTTHVKLTNVSRAGGMVIESFEVECFIGDRSIYTMDTVFGFFPPEAFEAQVGLTVPDEHRAPLELDAPLMVDLTTRPDRFCTGSPRLAEPMLLMLDRAIHIPAAGRAGLGVVRGEKDVEVTEWFFKAHFFQDPVQPGSLGIEALLQLLQFFMLDTDMAAGIEHPTFEPLMLDAPLTWKYRGQVTPDNALITSVMEITEVGHDDRGPFAVGTGSLWCDGLRIYEVEHMGMRIVPHPTVVDAGTEDVSIEVPATAGVEVPRPLVRAAMSTYWRDRRETPEAWLGDDLLDGLLERYVRRIMVERQDALDRLHGRPAIFLANHQVQIESLLISNLLPALTGVPMTTVSNAKHELRWIGEMIRALDAYPDSRTVHQVVYFDQNDPASMFQLIDGVRANLTTGPHSFFVHTDGTRSQSCRQTTQRCSSVFLDLSIELDLPIVPVRFTGGLPIEPITGKAEFPVGHGRQDYWIGAPIEADELRSLGLRERVDHVVSAINSLGGSNASEVPLPGDPAFATRVIERQRRTDVNEVYAACRQILDECEAPSAETRTFRRLAGSQGAEPDRTPTGHWLGDVTQMLCGVSGDEASKIVVSGVTHPHFVDHAVDATPVIPAAYALEWFARAVPGFAVESYPIALADLKVLNGVIAPEIVQGGQVELDLVTNADPAGLTNLMLVDPVTGRPRYSCRTAATTTGIGTGDRPAPTPAGSAAADPSPIYDTGGVLFHGPAFQVLADVRLSETGVSASVGGVIDRDWPSEAWVTDPALVDGALQLALLWSDHLLGGPSLPTSIASIRVYEAPRPGRLRAFLTGLDATNTKVRSDIVVLDDTGSVVVELSGVETHSLPRS